MEEIATAPIKPPVSKSRKTNRIESIDLLRGLIMIIMALDHVRDYFHWQSFTDDPLNLNTTTPLLYFTRWITHFCAPLFMFLSGTSAFLVGTRRGKKALSRFLLTRGLWLIFLEVTIVSFAWCFNPHLPITLLGVIWALGISMIALSALIYLPLQWIAAIGLLMVFGHDLLDSTNVPGNDASAFLWALVHKQNFFTYAGHQFFVAYPIIPWIGVMDWIIISSICWECEKWFHKIYNCIWKGSIFVLYPPFLFNTFCFGNFLPRAGAYICRWFKTPAKFSPTICCSR